MRNALWFALVSLALSVFAFTLQAAPPQIDPADPHRFVRGGQPWYPVGYTPNLGALTRRCDGIPLSQYYADLHTWMQSRGINYYRTVFTFGQPFAGQTGDACAGRLLSAGTEETLPYQRTGPGLANDGRAKFDLDRWNDAHFTYWRNVVADAAAKGITIELAIFDSFHNNKIAHDKPGTLGWGQRYDFYYGDNNVNGVTFNLDNGSEATWHNRNTSSAIFQRQKALVQKVSMELATFDNVIYEICNEPDDYGWALDLSIYLPSNLLVVQRDLLDHKQTIPNGRHDNQSIHATLSAKFSDQKPLMAHNDCADSTCLTDNLFEQRQRVWAALTAGGHYNHLFNLDEKTAFAPGSTADQAARFLGYARKFVEDLDVDLRGMTPSDYAVGSPVAGGAWAYARVGEEYVVYKRELANNRSVTVSGLSASHQGTWFDPRTGIAGPTVVGVASGSVYRFTPPSSTAREWLLHVVDIPMPEIRVVQRQNGVEVPDGGVYDFGFRTLAQLPTSRLFDICNDGTQTLVISNPTTLVSGFGFSQIGTNPSSSVAPGQCTNFRVRFHVNAVGSYTGTVRIWNNDANENPYDFTVRGTATN